ncbi:MAG: DUF4249 family protein [Flavobacteriales bacterium]|nr:DUF4249 family protein [Flavobacteriales bacterium]
MWKWTLIGLTAVAVLTGCSNDLEINAPYKESPVVYGLLNRTDRLHWVRINKAYLGEDNAFIYAQIPDSNEYTAAQLQNAVVEELDGSTVVNTYTLEDSILNNRVDGTFYNPVHKIYYFRTTSDLPQDHDFRVRFTAKGQEVTATTAIVNDFVINPTDANPNGKIGLVSGNGNYIDFELNWNSGKDGRRYQVSYVVKYVEVRNGTDSTLKELAFPMGTRVTGGLNGNEALNATIDGQEFYRLLGETIPNDPTVQKRVFKGIDLVFWVASDEFHTYLQLADPVSGIVEERPDYTNVNGGFGLFGSRYFKSVNNKQLNTQDNSVQELCEGQYTQFLNFCVPNTGFSCN